MGALRQEFSQAIERLTRVEGQVKEALTIAQEACDKVQAARTVADDVRKAADEAGREAKVAKQLAARSEERGEDNKCGVAGGQGRAEGN